MSAYNRLSVIYTVFDSKLLSKRVNCVGILLSNV